MSSVVLGCDSNGSDGAYQNTIAKGLEDAGYSVEKLTIGPNPFANYDYAKNGKNPKGKIGVYCMAASLVSVTDAYEASPGFDYHYFIIRGDVSSLIKSENDFNTKGIPKDHDGSYSSKYFNEWAGKTYAEINELAQSKCKCVFAKNAEDGVTALLNAMSGVSPSNSQSQGDEEDEEEWDDKDNFTPHKGSIMEIKPYKEISNISFDKSYDSPTGTGNVELVYKAKDYRFMYKGVAMKLKLRRSCDSQWSATGVEEPDYDENEKFMKEHIPTDELLKELGLPNYRKQSTLKNTNNMNNTVASTDEAEAVQNQVNNLNNNSNTSSNSGNSNNSGSSSSSNSNKSRVSVSGRATNPSGKSLRKLSANYINSITPQHALQLAKQTSVYDKNTIKRLRRRSLGLYW